MAITVDYITKVISVPQGDLTFVSGTLYELDTETFRQTMKSIEASENGIHFDDMHQRNAPYTVAGVTYAQSIEIINGYSVTFTPNSAWSVRLIGSNNNIFDIESGILNQNQVQVIPTNSAGLIDVNKQDIESGAYNSQIYLDTTNGTDGVGHPFGAERAPVKTQAVAVTRAVDRAINRIKIVNPITTIDNTVSMDGYLLLGDSRASTVVTFVDADTGDMGLHNLHFTGSMNGGINADKCVIGTITGAGCTVNETLFTDCLFEGNVQIRPDNTQPFAIVNCGSIENNQMVLDVNGTSGDVTIQNYADRIKIINMTTAINLHISSAAGCELDIDASCTAVSLLEVHGNVNIINNSGLSVDDDTAQALVWQEIIETEGNYTGQQVMSIILAVLAGITTDAGATFKTPNGVATRVAAILNDNNERTSQTLTPSS